MRLYRTAGLALVLLTSFAATATAAPQASPAPAPTPAPSSKPKPRKHTHHTVSGAIDAYDAAAHTLTIKTSKSSIVFQAAEAKVWVGAKSVALDDIGAQKGSQATVTYALKAGEKKASSVRIAEPKAK